MESNQHQQNQAQDETDHSAHDRDDSDGSDLTHLSHDAPDIDRCIIQQKDDNVNQQNYELVIVGCPDAVIYPFAVVVQHHDALVTFLAVG